MAGLLRQGPSGQRGLLVPIRVSDVEPPGLLTTRIYVDLVGRDASSARAALLAAARGTRGKPAQAPEFPGDRRHVVCATEAPRFPGELPHMWNVPSHPNPFFVGRDLLLAELQTRLTVPDLATRRVVLTGLGGVGKTSVAVAHAYRRQADYGRVWWVNGEQLTSLLADLAALAGRLGLAADASQEAQAAALRGWLEHHPRWLLVLDNVDDPQAVAEWLPRSGTGQVVITSRTGVGWERLASVLPVEVLAPTDAAGLLLLRTEETGPASPGGCDHVGHDAGGTAARLGAGRGLRRRHWHGHLGWLCGAVRHPSLGAAATWAAAGLPAHRGHYLVAGPATLAAQRAGCCCTTDLGGLRSP